MAIGAMGRGFEFSFGAHEPSAEQLQKQAAANAKYLPLLERLLARGGRAAAATVAGGGGSVVGAGFTMGYLNLGLTYVDVLLLEGLEQVSAGHSTGQPRGESVIKGLSLLIVLQGTYDCSCYIEHVQMNIGTY